MLKTSTFMPVLTRLSLGLLVLTLCGGTLMAQKSKPQGKPKTITLKSNRIESGRGAEADPNITDDKETNDPNAKPEAPPAKGGTTTRGAGVCQVRLDNSTPYFIKIYVDGNFRGTMSPWADAVVYTGAGPTRVYARANFEDGSGLNWGPSLYDCYSGQYINFRMTP